MGSTDSDRREFTRLRSALAVRYKFISSSERDPLMERICEGTTANISVGGLLLLGPLPKMEWLKDLLVGRMSIGINLTLSLGDKPIKALTRIIWVEAMEEGEVGLRMGLRIVEMPPDHRRMLSDFLIRETSVP